MRPLSTNKELLFNVLDIETTITKGSPSAFIPENRIVMVGCCNIFSDPEHNQIFTHPVPPGHKVEMSENSPMIVGHNLDFDLHHIRFSSSEEEFDRFIASPIWDTQIAAYILSAQTHKFASLDELAKKYGLDTKDTDHAAITDMFNKGIGADCVPESELRRYLKHDLRTTGDIAMLQMAEATPEQFDLIVTMGEALKAVQEMEYNGMFINQALLEENILTCVDHQSNVTATLDEDLSSILKNNKLACQLIAAKPTWFNSGDVLSALFFGGEIKIKTKKAIGFYKSGAKKGKVRYKVEEKVIEVPRSFEPDEMGSTETKKKGTFTCDEGVLKNLANAGEDLAHDLLSWKKTHKVLNTYLINFREMADDEGLIHHELNQCATATGRLSSSKPNLQNVPMAGGIESLNVKANFTSRFEHGVIAEVDFKQLEVCVLAWLTRDPRLILDIESGIDIHGEVGKKVYGHAMDKRARRDVKSVVFAMLYGAGAKGISRDSGIPLGTVKEILNAFKSRYKQVDVFYKNLMESMERVPDEVYRTPTGDVGHWWEYTSATGRTYWMHEDPYRMGPKYTEARNYPVQGTATGDIVPAILGKVREMVHDMSGVKMINTTHDSITFDVENKALAEVLAGHLNRHLFNEINDFINETYPNMKWDVPLEVEWEIGESWGSMEKLDIP